MAEHPGGAESPPTRPGWRSVLAWGIVSAAMGGALLLDPAGAVTMLLAPLAVFWLVGGVIEIGARRVLRGGVRLLAAAIVFASPLLRPVMSVNAQLLVLALAALFDGIASIVEVLRRGGSSNPLALGLVQMAIGLLLLANPIIRLATLITALAVESIVAGAVLIVVALWMRGADRPAPQEPAEPAEPAT
jgi:uncharacterized membrane protein HdeD (DUF308 family)